MIQKKVENQKKTQISESDLKKLIDYIESVQYGSVTLIIQDCKIVQIEKSEKIRLKWVSLLGYHRGIPKYDKCILRSWLEN